MNPDETPPGAPGAPDAPDAPDADGRADVPADPAGAGGPDVFDPDPLRANGPDAASPAVGSLGLLSDVDMEVTVELGRTTMPIRELLALQPGMVVEIERAAAGPIDVLVNGRLIARGEVVVIDEEFGVRVTEIVATRDVV